MEVLQVGLIVRVHDNRSEKMIEVLELLQVVYETHKGKVPLVLDGHFLFERKVLDLNLLNRKFGARVPAIILFIISIAKKATLLLHFSINIINWMLMFVLLLFSTMGFDSFLVRLLIGNVLKLQGLKILKVCFFDLLDNLFKFFFQLLLS